MPHPRERARFLAVWAVTLAACLALVAAFNFAVDPYGYFGTRLGRFNAAKPRPDLNLLPIKLAGAARVHPSALIVGNSRADIGFDPAFAGWAQRGLSAYNLGVPGSGTGGEWRAMRGVLAHDSVRYVLFGLEFGDFLDAPDWKESTDTALGLTLADRAKALVSLTALNDSITTLRIQHDPYAAVVTDRGFNPLRDYLPIARDSGYYVLFRQRAEGNAAAYLALRGPPYAFERPRSESMVALEHVIDACARRGIDLSLVIYPYHAEMLLLYEETGVWPAFEQWKREMMALVARHRAGANAHLALWDFSGIHRYSSERIPAPGDRASVVQWYWEAGHFKKALGDKVLARVLDGNADDDARLGHPLTPGNVDAEIAAARADLERFRAAHPELVAEVRSVVRQACAALGPRAGPRCQGTQADVAQADAPPARRASP